MIGLYYELRDVPHNRSGKFKNGYTPTDCWVKFFDGSVGLRFRFSRGSGLVLTSNPLKIGLIFCYHSKVQGLVQFLRGSSGDSHLQIT